MRKLVWGGAVTCLVTGVLGTYLAMSSRHAEPTLAGAGEEQEAPVAVFTPIPLAEPLPCAHDGAESVEAIEPIVVEGAEPTVASAPTFDAEALASAVAATPAQQGSRPDEEPGQEKKMPYAGETGICTIPGGMLWEALCRVLTGEAPPVAATEEQTEPPLASPVKPEEVQAPLSVLPMSYHQHEQCCPYTGRCAMPYHPAAPRP